MKEKLQNVALRLEKEMKMSRNVLPRGNEGLRLSWIGPQRRFYGSLCNTSLGPLVYLLYLMKKQYMCLIKELNCPNISSLKTFFCLVTGGSRYLRAHPAHIQLRAWKYKEIFKFQTNKLAGKYERRILYSRFHQILQFYNIYFILFIITNLQIGMYKYERRILKIAFKIGK